MAIHPQTLSQQVRHALFASMLVCLPWSGPTLAGEITIGLPAYAFGGNCLPFGCVNPAINRYQEVYSNTVFPVFSPYAITEIDFFRTTDFNSVEGLFNSGNYTLSLSTTSKPVGGLDTSDFDANLGPDNAVVVNAVLGGGPAGSVLSFYLGTPFVYDPTEGNLLLDIQMSNLSHANCPSCSAAYFDLPVLSGGRMGRAFGGPTGGGQDLNDALVTRFQFVPEPATVTLFGAALMAIVLLRRRERRQTARATTSYRNSPLHTLYWLLLLLLLVLGMGGQSIAAPSIDPNGVLGTVGHRTAGIGYSAPWLPHH